MNETTAKPRRARGSAVRHPGDALTDEQPVNPIGEIAQAERGNTREALRSSIQDTEYSACQPTELKSWQDITCQIGNRAVSSKVQGGAIWLSQKELAKLFSTTPQAITMHISKINAAGVDVSSKCIRVRKVEGGRTITRNVTHYDMNTVHQIAMRSQRFEEFNALQLAIQNHGISPRLTYIVQERQERGFTKLILKLLEGVTAVHTQYRVGPHLLDIYLPEFAVAIEYDEAHHSKPSNREADAERQKEIKKQVGCTFVRVPADDEIAGINQVLRLIWKLYRQSSIPAHRIA